MLVDSLQCGWEMLARPTDDAALWQLCRGWRHFAEVRELAVGDAIRLKECPGLSQSKAVGCVGHLERRIRVATCFAGSSSGVLRFVVEVVRKAGTSPVWERLEAQHFEAAMTSSEASATTDCLQVV